MERPAKKQRVTEDRDKDTVPTESKQQHIQQRGSASTGKPHAECKSESLAGSQVESDENHGSSTSETDPCDNDGSSTSKSKAYDNDGSSAYQVNSDANDESSGSEVSFSNNNDLSRSENESSESSGWNPNKEEAQWRAKEEADEFLRYLLKNYKEDSWLAALTRSERRVFLGLVKANFQYPWSIIQIITKMAGGYVVVCKICEEEVHDSESKPELPCWCETETLAFDAPLPLFDSCHYKKYSFERDEPISYIGFGPWLSCSKCSQPIFNWGVCDTSG